MRKYYQPVQETDREIIYLIAVDKAQDEMVVYYIDRDILRYRYREFSPLYDLECYREVKAEEAARILL